MKKMEGLDEGVRRGEGSEGGHLGRRKRWGVKRVD